MLGVKIGKGSFVHLGCYFLPTKIIIGNDTVIGRNVDIIGDVVIGDHVAIAAHCIIQSVSHHVNSKSFSGFMKRITIEDYVWFGNRVVVLPGISVKKGGVVGANSLVSRDVNAGAIVVGSPAREINIRSKEGLQYCLNYRPMFN